MPRLTITRGPLAGQQFGFDESVVVGRGAYSDIRLDDSTVSRRHAELRCNRDAGWQLSDLGSANGTLCDGRMVEGPTDLGDSAEIVFGEVATRFEVIASTPDNQPERSVSHMLGRLELLTAVSSLPARRDDPLHLIGQALDAILATFVDCRRVGVFVARPGASAALAMLAQRERAGSGHADASAALAQAALRNVDGLAGNPMLPASTSGVPASALAMPLTFAGETHGALVAESDREDCFAAIDRPLGKALAAVLASLLDARRSQHPERRIAERDLLLARRVQQHFLHRARSA